MDVMHLKPKTCFILPYTYRQLYSHFLLILRMKYGQTVMASGCYMLLNFTDKLTCHVIYI